MATTNDTAIEGKLRASLDRLSVEPNIADKTVRLLRFANDTGLSATDVRSAVEMIRSSGANGVGAALLPAAVLSGAGGYASYVDLKVVAMGTNELATSLNVGKALGMRPNKALATVVLMLAQKGLAAAGILDASEVTKCREAVARLIADVGVTALTWESGIGAYLGVTGGLLDAKEAFDSCRQTQP